MFHCGFNQWLWSTLVRTSCCPFFWIYFYLVEWITIEHVSYYNAVIHFIVLNKTWNKLELTTALTYTSTHTIKSIHPFRFILFRITLAKHTEQTKLGINFFRYGFLSCIMLYHREWSYYIIMCGAVKTPGFAFEPLNRVRNTYSYAKQTTHSFIHFIHSCFVYALLTPDSESTDILIYFDSSSLFFAVLSSINK